MPFINGIETDRISILDRGFMYGDGVFRTLRAKKGAPLHWDRHYQKLAHDCQALGIACPGKEILQRALMESVKSVHDCVVKILVTRGEGARGYAPPATPNPSWVVMPAPAPEHPREYYDAGIKLTLCKLRLGHQPRIAGIKHLNRLENVLARQEWSDASIAEGLLLDHAGNVISGTMSNLFLVSNGALVTPDLRQCGVAGVQRERILESAQKRGVATRIENVRLEAVLGADEVFLCNSVIGVWPVVEFQAKTWSKGKTTADVVRWLNEEST